MDNSNKKATYYDKQPKLWKNEPSKLKEHMQKGMTTFLVIAAGILFFFLLLKFSEISIFFGEINKVIQPIMYGFIIAFLLNPVMKTVEKTAKGWLEEIFKNKKTVDKASKIIGVLLALAFGIAIVVALLNMVIPELYKSISNLVVTLPRDIENWIEKLNSDETNSTVQQIGQYALVEGSRFLEEWIRTDLLTQTEILLGKVTGGVISVLGGVIDVLVGVMTSVYILFSKDKFLCQAKKILYAMLKPKQANGVIHVGRKANEIFSGFIIGKIIDSLIIGVLCFLGLSVLKMPYVLLVSVIVGVTNVIPVFGPYIGAIPSIILIFLASPIQGLYFAIFILILQQIDGNIIGPAILGDSTGLSPFWVIFSIVIGGGLFGIPGMIIGVPTFALIYYIIQLLISQRLEHKNLPVETDAYTSLSYVDDEGHFVAEDKQEKEK